MIRINKNYNSIFLRGERTMIEHEWQHLKASNRTDKNKILEILHPDFKEFGKSGKIFYKSDIKNMTLSCDDFTINNFEVYELGNEAKLCTYELKNTTTGTTSNRSSVWQFYDNEWLLLFHQGTELN